MKNFNEGEEEAIRNLAYVVWQERTRKGDPNAGDEKENWLIAKHCLYPECLEFDDLEHLTRR